MFTNRFFKGRKRRTLHTPIDKFVESSRLPKATHRDTVSYILSKDGDLIAIEDNDLLNIIEEKNAAIS